MAFSLADMGAYFLNGEPKTLGDLCRAHPAEQAAAMIWESWRRIHLGDDLDQLCRWATKDSRAHKELAKRVRAEYDPQWPGWFKAKLADILLAKPPHGKQGETEYRNVRMNWLADVLVKHYPDLQRTTDRAAQNRSAASIIADLPRTPAIAKVNNILNDKKFKKDWPGIH